MKSLELCKVTWDPVLTFNEQVHGVIVIQSWEISRHMMSHMFIVSSRYVKNLISSRESRSHLFGSLSFRIS